MTDSLKAIIGANSRYVDWITRKPAETRTGAEIAADVIKKAGLKIKVGPADIQPPDRETRVVEN